MAGGGDLGGLGGDMGGMMGGSGSDPFGGMGPSSGGGSDPFSGDPSLTGGDPMSSGMGMGGMGGGGMGGVPDMSAGGSSNPAADPNVGAPQSQAPTPGTTPTSFGGVQSGASANDRIQQAFEALSGQKAGSPGQTLTTTASQVPTSSIPASQVPTNTIPGSSAAPGALPGSSSAASSFAQRFGDSNQFAPSVPNSSQGAASANVPPPGAQDPQTSNTAGKGDMLPPPSGDKGDKLPPPSGGKGDKLTPPAAATPPATATAPADTATPPAATAPPAGTPPPTAGNPMSQAGYGGGSPTQQQMNPAKLIGDLLQAVFGGNVQPLLHDLASGQMGSGNWESAGNPPGVPPWAPGYGPQSRIRPGTQPPAKFRQGAGAAGGGGGGGTGTQQTTAQQAETQSVMNDELTKAGASPNAISGIMANVRDESGFNPTLRHPDQPHFGGEAHFAHGLYQEGGDEWNHYAQWLQQKGQSNNWKDPRLQTQFLGENLKARYPGTWQRMNAARTPGEAAQIFLREYLKPAAGPMAQRAARYGRGVPTYTAPQAQQPPAATTPPAPAAATPPPARIRGGDLLRRQYADGDATSMTG